MKGEKMSDIRTKPVTPEYEDSYERVFGKKPICTLHDDRGDIIAVIEED